jgi:uncharacterized membrane protein YdjX (TVP38/TMEM64 family)
VTASERSRPYRRVALGVAIVVFVAIAVVVWRTGAITPGGVQRWLDSLGPWAPLVFLGAFIGGSLIGLPGIPFVVGARLAFGPWLGFALGYGGGVAAVLTPFLFVRLLRRNAVAPWRPKNRWLRKALDRIETQPVRAVILLRAILWFNQPVSYSLGLAPIRFRDYFLGCAIALLPVVIVATGG